MAEVEAVVQPDSIADDIWRESVALLSIHGLIIRSDRLTCQYLVEGLLDVLETY